jgi:hypothetical protein
MESRDFSRCAWEERVAKTLAPLTPYAGGACASRTLAQKLRRRGRAWRTEHQLHQQCGARARVVDQTCRLVQERPASDSESCSPIIHPLSTVLATSNHLAPLPNSEAQATGSGAASDWPDACGSPPTDRVVPASAAARADRAVHTVARPGAAGWARIASPTTRRDAVPYTPSARRKIPRPRYTALIRFITRVVSWVRAR